MLCYSSNLIAKIDRTKAPNSSPISKINIKQPIFFQLKNGLKVFIVKNQKIPLVNINLKIDYSPILEGNLAGLQSIFGSMLRSGTKNYTKEQIDELIDQLGTTIYTFSSGIYLSTLKRYLGESVKLLSEILLNTTFDNNQEFQKLIKQNITNIKISEKDPKIISERVRKILYYGKNHPYGEYESYESLKKITIQDLKNFYKTYIKPNISYLVFIGDITKNEAKKLVNQYFSTWEKGNVPIEKYIVSPLPKKLEINLINLSSITQSNIIIGGPINFKKSSSDYFAGFLANSILGGGTQSYLFQNLRERHGYTYGAYSKIEDNKYIGSFSAIAQVKSEVTNNAIIEFINELQRITSKSVSLEDLNIKKKEITGQFILGLENPKTIADFTINELIENLPKKFYQNYLNNLQKVGFLEIMLASKKYILLQNARIIIIGEVKKILPQLKKLNYPIYLFDIYGNFLSSVQ